MFDLSLEKYVNGWYHITMEGGQTTKLMKGEKPMAGKKKNGNQDKALHTIVLITAILNLIRALVDIVERLLE